MHWTAHPAVGLALAGPLLLWTEVVVIQELLKTDLGGQRRFHSANHGPHRFNLGRGLYIYIIGFSLNFRMPFDTVYL